MDASHGVAIDNLQVWMYVLTTLVALIGALAGGVWNNVKERLDSVEKGVRGLEVKLAEEYAKHESVRDIADDLKKQIFDRLDRQDRDLGEKLRDLSSRLDRQASAVQAFYGRHMDQIKGE